MAEQSPVPKAVLEFDELPVIGPEFVEHHNFCVQLFTNLKGTFLAHDGPRIAHAAAIANRERPRTHGLELAQDRHQCIFMSGAGRGIRAVEIGLNEEIFAAEFIETDEVDGALDARGAVRGLDESHMRNGGRRVEGRRFQQCWRKERCSHGG